MTDTENQQTKNIDTSNKINTDTISDQEQSAQVQNIEQITLSIPEQNQNHQVQVSPGMEIRVDFDLDQITIEQNAQDLLLHFNDGGTITLQNFTSLTEGNRPPFIMLEDGTVLTAEAILASLETEEVEPAAGEGNQSGGAGQYEDDPGSILEGINKLDGLDFAQPQGRETPEIQALSPNTESLAIDIDVIDVGATRDNTPTINGSSVPGATVIVEVGGVTMATTAGPDGRWSVTIPDGSPLPDGSYTITGTATDEDGNISTDIGRLEVDTIALAEITIDPDITPDDIINAAEEGTNIAITGTVGGDVSDGDIVTLTVNGNTYTGPVSSGRFNIDVPGSALTADTDNTIEASVTGTDQLGNTATATDTESYGFDTTLPTASITLDADITADDLIDAAEEGTDIAITGTVGGDVQDGDIVTLTINGGTYTGPVSGGTFSINVPGSELAADPDTTINASVTTTDDVGNSATASDSEGYSVDDAPVANADTITVDEDSSVSGDLSTNDTPSGDGGNVWSLNTGAGHGTAVVNPDGTYTYTPDPDYNGPDNFTYTITDADGDTSMATVTIGVNPVNDAATVSSASEVLSETNAPVSTSGTLTSTDVD
ncbi:MAG: Ig-like domain-containing protein, partial [Desulfobacteraceae bacterium]|nr:Ig-like domain-containing protein [Desulfobacteraceae bacterium]